MRYALPLFIALWLTACGSGSSGGGGDSTPPVSPPVEQGFTLAGAVTASGSQAVDGDTNDPGSAYKPNNTLASAQVINNPTTLGGYVNQPGSGAQGRSFAAGDVDDFFSLDLLAGQSVTLLVADFEVADADLYLYDSEGVVVDYSLETGEMEHLVVPADGSYRVNVNAFFGATNYILAIGSQAGAASFSRQHYIEPWQAVVRYRGRYRDTQLRRAIAEAELAPEQRGGGPDRARLLLRRNLVDQQYLSRRLGPAMHRCAQFVDDELLARFETLMTIKQLRSYPEVALAEPNYQKNPSARSQLPRRARYLRPRSMSSASPT